MRKTANVEDLLMEAVMEKPAFREIYERHHLIALKNAFQEGVDLLTEEEKQVIRDAARQAEN